ncbi:MAG: DUF2726 domain-containing protein [Chloroflexota bacterium]|nr:DUF2726 domain-containing protein [Chloroflexota bacterium]
MTRNEPPGCLDFFLRLFRRPSIGPPTEAPAPIATAVSPILAPAAAPAASGEPPTAENAAPVYNFAACQVQTNFISRDEREFFRVLSQAVAARYVIFSKVGLGSLFDVPRLAGATDWKTRGQFSQKHVDFLLCDPNTLKPILGIELDDRSHRRPESRARDKIKDDVFRFAKLPLLRIDTQHTFVVEDIAARIAAKLGQTSNGVGTETETGSPISRADTDVPACPRCGAPMVRKIAKHGPGAGHPFYSCANFPDCRGTRPIN